MKKWISGVVLVVSACAMVGWGTAGPERDSGGDAHADRNRQEDDENIKRTQGDEGGRRS